jgi:hypothetical protein
MAPRCPPYLIRKSWSVGAGAGGHGSACAGGGEGGGHGDGGGAALCGTGPAGLGAGAELSAGAGRLPLSERVAREGPYPLHGTGLVSNQSSGPSMWT